jgi:MFS family permease
VRAYRELFGLRAAVLLAVAMLPVRLGYAMAGLSLVLLGAQKSGSYAVGGAALGLFSLGAGALGPFRGSLVDRYGQTRPLLIYVPAFCAGFLALAATSQTWVLLTVAALSGMLSPPLLASSRTLWRSIVPPHLVRTAFALDSVSMQVTQVAGPAFAGLIAARWGASTAMIVVTVLVMTGGIAFVALPSSRAWKGSTTSGGLRGILRSAAVRTLLLVGALGGVSLGVLVVALPAMSESFDTPFGAGLLLAVLAVGSVAGGTWAGTHHRLDAADAAARAAAALALILVPVVLTTLGGRGAQPWLLLLAGAGFGPLGVYLLELVDRAAPTGTAVTAFAAIVALEGATVAIGATVAGFAADRGTPEAALLVSIACLLGMGYTYHRQRLVLQNRPPHPGANKVDQWAAESQSAPVPTDTSNGTARA